MIVKPINIKQALLIAIVLFSTSCSTKKKAWINRQYHNTTAKFNGYFNGNESLKLGVKKIYQNHKDDYTSVLPLYKTGDLAKSKKTHSYMDKAIKKGSVVIQRHSMKIKGKEYCKWIDDNYLLVGKAYFYKGEFDEAIKTFIFIKNEYNKNDIRFEASLWLIRSYVQKGEFITAEAELGELENEKKFPKKLYTELAKVSADYYLQQKNFPLALEQLKELEQLIKRRRKKVRYNYIMAQIYQQNKNYKKAQKQYEKVLKSNAEYEMVFNAKMNLARSLESGSQDSEKMRKKLLKMTKDDKNKEYLDQIYFTLAKIDINNNDTVSATENYNLSTINSINNDPQKAVSFLSLAEIEYTSSRYRTAKTYYDSTIYYMQEDFRLYDETQETHEILIELVNYLDVFTLQDSLQKLAKLPNPEIREIIDKIIKKEIEKEREEANAQRIKQQIMYENNRNGGRGEQFGNNTSGGKWYFYNPATLSFGMSEFRKKWGKRKLEDDWRRKDKKIAESFEADSNKVDSSRVFSRNKKDPNFYLEKLPKTKEDFEKSNTKIKEALYQAGVLYRENLKKYTKSSEMFMKIPPRFPLDEDYTPLAYYNVFINHTQKGNIQEAEKIKTKIITKYPNSICAKLLIDPDFQTEKNTEKNEEENQYSSVYQKYLSKQYDEVISLTNTLKEDIYKTKKMFLRALSFAQKKDTIKVKKTLKEIIKTKPKTKITTEAEHLLSTLNNPENMLKSNELALSSSPYIFKKITPHMLLIILPKKDVDINYFKTIISDYHANDFENEVFEISAMLMGQEQHLVMIKTFLSAVEAVSYQQLFIEEASINKTLNKTNHKVIPISLENFKEFYKYKDIKGYEYFYKKNYSDNN